MKKSELKTGMVIEIRDGCQGIIMLGSSNGDIIAGNKENVNGTWCSLDEYDDDLIYPNIESACIIKVYRQGQSNNIGASIRMHGELLWERKEEKAIVTLDGVEYSETTLRSLIKKATK